MLKLQIKLKPAQLCQIAKAVLNLWANHVTSSGTSSHYKIFRVLETIHCFMAFNYPAQRDLQWAYFFL
jgi:hypothetical protein